MASAVDALRLSMSYLEEVEQRFDELDSGDGSLAQQLSRTLDLAKKQIELAEQLDPNVAIEEYNLPEARLKYHYWRAGLKSSAFKDNAGAIEHLSSALAIDESFAPTHFMLAQCYAASGRKSDALVHARRAVELDSENMEYRKSLDRLENVSGAALQLGTFRGSWKVLLVLAGLTLLFTIGGFGSGQALFGIVCLLVGGGVTYAYWRWKHR